MAHPSAAFGLVLASILAASSAADFQAEAAGLNFEVMPVSGEALERVAARVTSTPKELAARARQFLE